MRLLLTQSQVSVVVSSGIVCLFTLLLFLSGYILQQRNVHGLKQTIKPRIPKPPPSHPLHQQQDHQPLQPSRLFADSKEGSHVAYTDFKNAQAAVAVVDWQRLAHIQLVRNHHDVCSAIMVLAEFHKQKSPAKRLLLFPQMWAAEKGDVSDPFVGSSRRLMRLAARRYGVELRPIAPLKEGNEGEDGVEDVYSLTSAYGFEEFDRLLSIETPGLVKDALALDAVLAFTESAPLAMLHDTAEGDGVHADDLLLLQPSHQTHEELTKHLASQPSFNDTQLPLLLPGPLLLEARSGDTALTRSVGTLHDFDSDFNQTAFLSDIAYMRFSDPKLPGPEYDVPWSQRVAARPKNKDADWIWTKLYGEFAQKRMEVCGLDLDHWHGVRSET